MPIRTTQRSGLTLMEVLISVAVFFIGLTAIGQMYMMGSDRALLAQLKEEGVFLCQSKLAEFSAGIELFENKSDQAFEHDEQWTWSCNCEQKIPEPPFLWSVEIQVKRERAFGSPVIVTLRQLIIDPQSRGSSLDAPPERAEEQETDEPEAEEGTTNPGN